MLSDVDDVDVALEPNDVAATAARALCEHQGGRSEFRGWPMEPKLLHRLDML